MVQEHVSPRYGFEPGFGPAPRKFANPCIAPNQKGAPNKVANATINHPKTNSTTTSITEPPAKILSVQPIGTSSEFIAAIAN
jgi:hypothetical protein